MAFWGLDKGGIMDVSVREENGAYYLTMDLNGTMVYSEGDSLSEALYSLAQNVEFLEEAE